ncbi:MAG: aldose 1-epimerase family protein [Gemmataceae bacterium]|nr:aldose 1-epimerase family protein [Gemmataceae bacterium]MDW8263792.1 aldose 1-epimerase family protein [Gemmataceae bacterium]
MARYKSWTLTDVASDVWLDSFAVANDTLHLPTPHDWSVRKRTLRGGLRDGVDLIDVHNGALSFAVVPTRGMGLWRGEYRGDRLGWRSPVLGPVHPRFVPLADRGGLGWLDGFDELLCRCGLESNGPPGEDVWTDDAGLTHRQHLTLHGRIANLPAHLVEVRVGLEPPFELSVIGQVDEARLFGPNLRLTTTYTTVPGSPRLVIHDVVENRAAQPGEMQLLYHLNVGPPFLGAGSRVVAPLRQVVPRDGFAAAGMDTYDTFLGPTVGFAEQVYYYELVADSVGRSLVMLCTAAADRGLVVRFSKAELPCFTLWKNTGALEDGYVCGLEPAINYPNFRAVERKHGRVRRLPPGGRWEATWTVEVADSRERVAAVLAEIGQLQATAPATIHRTPRSDV